MTLIQYGLHTLEHIYECTWESDLMWRIDMRHFGVDGVATMMMPWWQHLGMG